jgi:hypothetical protein
MRHEKGNSEYERKPILILRMFDRIEWLRLAQGTSSTSRTLCASRSGVNGFCKNAV